MLTAQKMELTRLRMGYLERRMGAMSLAKIDEIEARFGQYTYIPLDVPKINIGPKLKAYFDQYSKPIKKIQPDVAGYPSDRASFNSIDYLPGGAEAGIWERNIRNDILDDLPELVPLLEAMPYTTIPGFMLWSSNFKISFHRDSAPWIDSPCSIRALLYDENPEQTLMLRESPSEENVYATPQFLPTAPETNCFAWNNLRSFHGSNYTEHKKILMIVDSGRPFNMEKFEDLLERSVSKYGQYAIRSERPLSDFVLTH